MKKFWQNTKTWQKIICIILAGLILGGTAGFIIFHSLYTKMNIDSTELTQDELEAALALWDEEGAFPEELYSETAGEDATTDASTGQDETEAVMEPGEEYEETDETGTEDYLWVTDDELTTGILQQDVEDSGEEFNSDKDVWNILLLGSDARDISKNSRSDTMILVSINRDTKKIILTSFMRDIYTSFPGREKQNRLNAACLYGGPKFAVYTIQTQFKIKIDNYVMVNFFTFIDVIDYLGGVDVCPTDKEIGCLNDNLVAQNVLRELPDETDFISHDLADTVIHMNGNQALAFARIRYVGGDQGRTERQRNMLISIFDIVKGMSITEQYNLLTEVLPLVRTDISETTCLNCILHATDYIDYEIVSIRIPYDGAYSSVTIDNMSVIDIDWSKCISYLKKKIYN